MNCIFCCIFNEKNVDIFYLLLESILIYGHLDNTKILIYTSTSLKNMIIQNQLYIEDLIHFEINDSYNNIDADTKSRLDLFDLPSISEYSKILYLDTDIIIKSDINRVFNICTDDILYVLEEGNIMNDVAEHYWSNKIFTNNINEYEDTTAFTSGIILFNNCDKIKMLFDEIKQTIVNMPYNFKTYAQPYIVYNAFKFNLYDNKKLKTFVTNNDHNMNSNMIIHHFPGGQEIYRQKISSMTHFLNNLNKNKFPMGVKLYDVKTPPPENTKFSLIGLCVSYNYFDSLKFMLPCNYLHFKKLYIITQEDDIDTINFCKNFDNVIVLFYNFKNNNKIFDKFGGLNYAQNIAYRDYPESWYLIIDSDILLPNNFINILKIDTLNSNCIYGASSSKCLKSSQLLNKANIICVKENNSVVEVSIIYGFFQLYKKKVFHRNNLINSSRGDLFFHTDNFNICCLLQDLLCIHLGEHGKNWDGKVVFFIDDANIELKNIYYNYHKKVNNIYYNSQQVVAPAPRSNTHRIPNVRMKMF